jgi:hypothetical protein
MSTTTMSTWIAGAAAAILLTGCATDETTAPDVDASAAPELPAARTMDFDFSFFAGAEEARAADEARWNWFNAAVRVLYLQVALDAAFHIPATVFAVAIHQEPVLEEDETFLWSYDFIGEDGEDYAIRLRGRLDGVHVDWEMRVSASGTTPPLEDAVWFVGESSLLEDSGYWVFVDPLGDGEDVARVEWTDRGPGDRHLRFENVDASSEDLGDFVTYDVDAAQVHVVYHDEDEDLNTVIQWNALTGVGSITAPDYNDGEVSCWDTDLRDTECPGLPG